MEFPEVIFLFCLSFVFQILTSIQGYTSIRAYVINYGYAHSINAMPLIYVYPNITTKCNCAYDQSFFCFTALDTHISTSQLITHFLSKGFFPLHSE